MKILKDGKRNSGAFKFKCSKCGCKFKADASDYVYVKETSSDVSENTVIIIFIIIHIIASIVLSGLGIVLKSVPVFIIGFLLIIEVTLVAFTSD